MTPPMIKPKINPKKANERFQDFFEFETLMFFLANKACSRPGISELLEVE